MKNITNTIHSTRLRCIIGWLGLLLPWLVVLILQYFPTSISATYYTQACATFMIILGSASILLFCYQGYDWLDDVINTVAGIAGLMICLFPCWVEGEGPKVGTFMLDMDTSNIVHCIGAGVFFGMLSINSLFRFTKTSGEMTPNKKKRNIIYRVCGIGMLASFTMFFLPDFHCRTWIIEAVALFFFGISFLTKANRYPWLFADTPSDIVTMFLGKITDDYDEEEDNDAQH